MLIFIFLYLKLRGYKLNADKIYMNYNSPKRASLKVVVITIIVGSVIIYANDNINSFIGNTFLLMLTILMPMKQHKMLPSRE